MKSSKQRPNALSSNGNSEKRRTWSPSKFMKMDRIHSTSKSRLLIKNNEKLKNFIFEHNDIKRYFGKITNVKEYSDLIFAIGGHILYAHRAIVEIRCPELLSVNLKEKHNQKGNITHIKIDQRNMNELILYALLCYIYSDSVNFNELTPNDVVQLMRSAEIYKLSRLIRICEKYLLIIINDDLFFDILKTASLLSVETAKAICFRYGKLNFGKILKKSEKISSLGIELFRELVVYVNNESSEVDRNDIDIPESTILQDMKKIYKNKQYCDGCFIFDNEKVEFHRGILNLQSEKMPTLLKFQSDPMKLLLPKNVKMSSKAFKAALSFMYYRNESFSSTVAAEIIPFALSYDIKLLYTICEKKIKEDINLESAIPILKLCYLSQTRKHVEEIYEPCISFVAANFYKLDFNDKSIPSELIVDVLQMIQDHIKEGKI